MTMSGESSRARRRSFPGQFPNSDDVLGPVVNTTSDPEAALSRTFRHLAVGNPSPDSETSFDDATLLRLELEEVRKQLLEARETSTKNYADNMAARREKRHAEARVKELEKEQAEIQKKRAEITPARTYGMDEMVAFTAGSTPSIVEAVMARMGASDLVKSSKPKRSAKFNDPPVFNGSEPPYDIWKLRAKDKMRNNADWWPSDVEKANVLIGFTSGDAAKHIDSRRLDNSDFYTCPNDVFEVLDSVYKNVNRVRDARKKFQLLMMKPNQSFGDFYSEFILLANQLSDYSEQTKMDSLEDKVTPKLQDGLASHGGEYASLLELKTVLQKMDQRFNNVRQATSSGSRSRYLKRSSDAAAPSTSNAPATSLVIAKHSSASSAPSARVLSSTEKKAYSNVAKQLGSDGCWNCGENGHLARDCPRGKANWLDKRIKEEVNLIDTEALQLYHMNLKEEASDTSEGSDGEISSEN